jgi:hypothetical protein
MNKRLKTAHGSKWQRSGERRTATMLTREEIYTKVSSTLVEALGWRTTPAALCGR